MSAIINLILPETIPTLYIILMLLWVGLVVFFSLMIERREEKFPIIERICRTSYVAIPAVALFLIMHYDLWC